MLAVISAPAGFFQGFQVNETTAQDLISATADALASVDAATAAATSAETQAAAALAAATAAQSSSASITTSVTAAATSATNAASSAGTAATSATNSATSATAAASSATTATTQATTATGAASTATTQATNATASATAASGSASAAATSASAAATSATASASSATAAASSASAVTTSLLAFFGGQLHGFITSRNTSTPTTKIDISAGAAVDEIAQAGVMTSAIVLTMDAATTGANGLDSGSLTTATWYHVFVIGKTNGIVAAFASTSLTPTLPVGYTYRRRLGSVKTDGSSHFLAYSQNNDEFLWAATVLDVSGTIAGTSAVLSALSVPLGVKVNALYRASYGDSAGASGVIFTSPDENDQVPASGGAGLSLGSPQASVSFGADGIFGTRTNTSSQIRWRASSATTTALTVNTYGWIDTRGRLS